MQSFRKADLSLLGNIPRSNEQDSISIRSLNKPTRSSPFQGTSTMFMHYTISEDRTGDDSSVRSGLLAGLGAKRVVGVRTRDSVDTGLSSHGVDDHQNLQPGDIVTDADDDSEAETLIQIPWPRYAPSTVVPFAGLHPSLSDETITCWFERFGEVKNCAIRFNPEDSSQSGHVTMALPKQVEAIKEQFSSLAELSRTLNTLTGASEGHMLQLPEKKWPLTASSTDVHVTELQSSFSMETISRWFERFGEVTYYNIGFDPYTGDASQAGIVRMALPEQAEAIKEQFSGPAALGRTLNILTGASEGQVTDTGRPRRVHPPSARGQRVEGRGFSNRVSTADRTVTSSPKRHDIGEAQQSRLSSMFMPYTISEDRCGDDAGARSRLLAALGTQHGGRRSLRTKSGGDIKGLQSLDLTERY